MPWTHFWDMHSGGSKKERWGHIFIEASEAEAVEYFERRFGHSPYRETCECCGEDYSLDESETFDFGEFVDNDPGDVLIISKDEM